MDRINSGLTRLVWGLREKLEEAEGIEAMEYLVMLIGLVVIIWLAYAYAGSRISDGIVSFFNNVGL